MSLSKHWVTVIETDAPSIYCGPRIAIFHSEEEANTDMLEWINNFFEDWEYIDEMTNVVEAMECYTNETARFCKIEECLA